MNFNPNPNSLEYRTKPWIKYQYYKNGHYSMITMTPQKTEPSLDDAKMDMNLLLSTKFDKMEGQIKSDENESNIDIINEEDKAGDIYYHNTIENTLKNINEINTDKIQDDMFYKLKNEYTLTRIDKYVMTGYKIKGSSPKPNPNPNPNPNPKGGKRTRRKRGTNRRKSKKGGKRRKNTRKTRR